MNSLCQYLRLFRRWKTEGWPTAPRSSLVLRVLGGKRLATVEHL
jgi:hypothetical protein